VTAPPWSDAFRRSTLAKALWVATPDFETAVVDWVEELGVPRVERSGYSPPMLALGGRLTEASSSSTCKASMPCPQRRSTAI
jgi:hypothetical protein